MVGFESVRETYKRQRVRTNDTYGVVLPRLSRRGYADESGVAYVSSISGVQRMTSRSIEEYFLPSRIPRGDIPAEIYIAFPRTLTDMDERIKLRSHWLMGNDRVHAAIQLMRPSKEVRKAIFRPSSIQFDFKSYVIVITSPSRIEYFLPFGTVENLPNDLIVLMLSDYMYIEFDSERTVHKFEPLRATVDVKAAREIIQHVDPYTAIVRGLGYIDNPAVKRILLPRVLSWFRVEGMPINIVQLTHPNTAKTTFGLRSGTLWNWEYINETPTLARLIVDASSGALGVVHMRNGIVFDEVDKWIGHKERMEVLLSVLNTGLEQHVWTRGISAKGIDATIRKPLPLVIFGNLPFGTVPLGILRKSVAAWFTDVFGVNCYQFIERFALVDTSKAQINANETVSFKVLPDSIIRGICSLVQDNVSYVEVSHNTGRMKQHANNVYAVLTALGFPVQPEQVDSYVRGDKSLDDMFTLGGTPA